MVAESDRGRLGSIDTPCAFLVERETGPGTPSPLRSRLPLVDFGVSARNGAASLVPASDATYSTQAKLTSRISNVFLPFGSWAVTESPTFLPISVRAKGARIEMRPCGGSASSEPTIQ